MMFINQIFYPVILSGYICVIVLFSTQDLTIKLLYLAKGPAVDKTTLVLDTKLSMDSLSSPEAT